MHKLLALSLLAACGHATGHPARVFVSNEDDGTVSVLEGHDVVATIPVGKRPRGLRVSGDTLFVALSGSPKAGPGVDESTLPPPDRTADGIGVVDLGSLRLTRVLESGPDPEAFDVLPDGKTLVVSNEETAEASIVDIASGQITAKIPVGREPEGVSVAPDGKVWVTSEADGQVDVIDPATAQVIASVPTAARPRAIAFAGGKAYVTDEAGGAVTVVDGNAPVATIAIPKDGEAAAGPRPMGIALAHDGAHVLVTTGRGGALVEIDTSTNEPTATIANVGARPWGVAVAPDGRVYTANGSSDDVSIVDPDDQTVVARVPVGKSPWGVAIAR